MTARKKKDDSGGRGKPDMVREVSSATWHVLGDGDRTLCGREIGGQVERHSLSDSVPRNTHVCKTCQRVRGEAS